jgi:hypothetical protein
MHGKAHIPGKARHTGKERQCTQARKGNAHMQGKAMHTGTE